VTPAEVGLVPGPRRRLAGLRRDELAMLAGISSEYLQRLEQGRDRHPSTEVLDSIARALAPGYAVGQNLSRWRFLDPAAKQVYPDWDDAAALAVRGLRALSADGPDDPRLRALVSELLSGSERFKQLWEHADVGYPKGNIHIRHPEVGDLYLTRTQLDLAQSPGQYIITLHAPANSASMHALDRLRASLQNNPVSDRGETRSSRDSDTKDQPDEDSADTDDTND
jgi:transcriptional regulator with XRE-family HTH domain